MKIKEIKIDKLKLLKILKTLPILIANHAFSVSLIIFLSTLLIGSFLFYKYFILAQKIDLSDVDNSYLLNEEAYKELKNTWQRQEIILEQSDSKEYPNPFIESLPFPGQ